MRLLCIITLIWFSLVGIAAAGITPVNEDGGSAGTTCIWRPYLVCNPWWEIWHAPDCHWVDDYYWWDPLTQTWGGSCA